MVALYHELPDRRQVEAALRPRSIALRNVGDRAELVESLGQATAAVIALPALRPQESAWLHRTFLDRPGSPACIVVTPLSIGAVQQARALAEHAGFDIVWAEEVADRLASVVERASTANPRPLWTLGRRIVGGPALRPLLREVASHICRLEIGLTYTPPPPVCQIAGSPPWPRHGKVPPGRFRDALARPPSPDGRSEQLVGWALLLQACESLGKPRKGADPTGLNPIFPKGTLGRCAARLLGWPLDRALQSPREVRSRFQEWQQESDRYGSSHPPPPTTIRDLCRLWSYDAATLRRYWGREMPLRCRSKQLLSWSMLFWALDQRRRDQPWLQVTRRAQCQRRTLERYSRRLASCGLQAAANDPSLANRAFWSWVNECWTDR